MVGSKIQYSDEQLKPILSHIIGSSTAENVELVEKYAKPGVLTAEHMALALKARNNPENKLNAHYAKKIADKLIKVAIKAQDPEIISVVLNSSKASELIQPAYLELAKGIHNNTLKPAYETQDRKTTGEGRARGVTTAYRIFAGLLQKSSINVLEKLASKHKAKGIEGLANEVNNELQRRKQSEHISKTEYPKLNEHVEKEVRGAHTANIQNRQKKEVPASLSI